MSHHYPSPATPGQQGSERDHQKALGPFRSMVPDIEPYFFVGSLKA
jgi:hypothetical protein